MIITNNFSYHSNKYFQIYYRLCISWSLAPIDMAVPWKPKPYTCLKGSFTGI